MKMSEILACQILILDGTTISQDVNVSAEIYCITCSYMYNFGTIRFFMLHRSEQWDRYYSTWYINTSDLMRRIILD